MELRVLQYFLAVTREQSILGASETLHLSQPTLSRQLRDLEQELGKKLFIRSNRKITLTEEGMILRKRAEEILELVSKTQDEISLNSEIIAGDIYIGAGESNKCRFLFHAAKNIQTEYPLVRFHIISDDKTDILENLDKGLLDFGIVFGHVDFKKYEKIKMPYEEKFGVLMRKDDPLAEKEIIKPSDLFDKPLIVSRQPYQSGELSEILNCNLEQINIVATYSLIFNASLMVKEGMGYAIGLDKIINVSGDSPLCFRPLDVPFSFDMYFIWKKYEVLTKTAEKFLHKIQEMTEE